MVHAKPQQGAAARKGKPTERRRRKRPKSLERSDHLTLSNATCGPRKGCRSCASVDHLRQSSLLRPVCSCSWHFLLGRLLRPQQTRPARKSPSLQCNGTPIFDPFKGKLAGPALPPEVLPIAIANKDSILKSGLPCQENARPGAQGDPAGNEASGLENLQRGFDFYSWRTFIALNSPADGTPIDSEKAQADTPTRWEDMNNFKQLLDVMLPADLQPPRWPADANGMKAERERLMPKECRDLLKNKPDLMKDAPNRMIVKMIEESFNEPFKTGPLIDQQGHYAIFDILMNRQMFEYITDNHLNTKAGQADKCGPGGRLSSRPE